MRTHRFAEHTADVRMNVSGSDLSELFTAALEGMASIIRKDWDVLECVQPVRHVLRLSSRDSTTLLVDFLSEVLTQSHLRKAVFISVRWEVLTETEVRAEVIGCPVEFFDEDIKAVTYHEADVKKNADGVYETTVVFDI